MMQRCYNPNANGYENYGGRNITVCERWRLGVGDLTAFECFLKDMGLKPTVRHTIERKDVNGNYNAENCVWATTIKQARNKRNSRMVVWKGKEMCLADACEMENIRYGLVIYRLNYGWDITRALTEKINIASVNNRYK
jgi:hypothetical protein